MGVFANRSSQFSIKLNINAFCSLFILSNSSFLFHSFNIVFVCFFFNNLSNVIRHLSILVSLDLFPRIFINFTSISISKMTNFLFFLFFSFHFIFIEIHFICIIRSFSLLLPSFDVYLTFYCYFFQLVVFSWQL